MDTKCGRKKDANLEAKKDEKLDTKKDANLDIKNGAKLDTKEEKWCKNGHKNGSILDAN